MTKKSLFFAWAAPIAIGWAIGTLFFPVNNAGFIVEILPNLLAASLIQGGVIGLFVGTGHWLLFHRKAAPKWIILQVFGFALVKPVGLVLTIFPILLSWMLNGRSHINPTLHLPYPASIDAIYGGWVIGLAWWFMLRDSMPKERNYTLLWILGAWASVGIGVVAGLKIDANPLGNAIAVGGIIGIVSGLILLITAEDPDFLVQTGNLSTKSSFSV